MKKNFLIFLVIVMALTTIAAILLSCCAPQFGRLPDGSRLERIKASPNYVNGEFRNLERTEILSEGSGRFSTVWDSLFKKWERRMPSAPLPMVKTDLRALDRQQDCVVWLGHSSCYIQLGGKRILIDPVFKDNAAPFSFLNKAFEGDYPYTADDMPDIDYLVISHDHWDHLEYPTLVALKPRIKAVICPLGVGAHLEHWGFASSAIHEGDWNESLRMEPGFTAHVLPARHFAGRFLWSNKSLWASFILEVPDRKFFYSGDSGYGAHFADIGERFGTVDLAIMENGQYSTSWHDVHMMPEEVAQAAEDMQAKTVLPVHSGRFSLAYHPWDDPYIRIAAASRNKSFRLLTPIIGEVVYPDNSEQTFQAWWDVDETE